MQARAQEQILLTRIVGREGVLGAHARFASTDSISRLLGPGIAGLLVQALNAPLAVLVTACILMVSMSVMRTAVHRRSRRRLVPGAAAHATGAHRLNRAALPLIHQQHLSMHPHSIQLFDPQSFSYTYMLVSPADGAAVIIDPVFKQLDI